MKRDSVKEFALLYKRLVQERDDLTARLADINDALSASPSAGSGSAKRGRTAEKSAVKKTRKRRAGKKAKTGVKAVKKVKRKMSPAARKRIADAQRRRWAKVKQDAKKA